MDNLELDHEIIKIHEAIDELTESKDYDALQLAQADLVYFLSLLQS